MHPSGQLGHLVGGGQTDRAEGPVDLEPDQLGQRLPVGGAGGDQLLAEGLELGGGRTAGTDEATSHVLGLLPGRLRKAHGQLEVGAPRVLHA
ncbi:hypothetical protein PCA76_12410 [Micromonospora sp. LH3U1]|nr:hypothetical protein [Micromonospora sp. LH3U1]WCN83784.1 hypothetical protein PCA76_12410 [Micromonospora sp. LH3U1]